MSFWEILLIGVGLSMDAAAVSIANMLSLKKPSVRDMLVMSFFYALFQCLMPVIGYFGASVFSEQLKNYDHWIALILLLFIGGKMIVEFFRGKDQSGSDESFLKLGIGIVLIQAVATSIDALAVGISFAALKADIVSSAMIIMAATFVICLIASLIAGKVGKLLKDKAELVGGLILVGIGIKIFLEHMLSGI